MKFPLSMLKGFFQISVIELVYVIVWSFLLIFWHSHHQLVCLNPKEQIHLSWAGPNATLLHMFEVDFYMFSIFFFLQYLAVGIFPGRLPIPCVNLNYLSLRINFNDSEEVLTALCLLRSSPNLQELEVLVSFFY